MIRNSAEWWMVWVTIGIGFIGFLQLIAFTFQARYMRRTVAEVQETTRATITAALATEAATNAAKSAAEDQMRFGHQIERAYISGGGTRGQRVIDISATGAPRMGDSGEFVFAINNYGKTVGTLIWFGWGFCDESNIPTTPQYNRHDWRVPINPGTHGRPFFVQPIPQQFTARPVVYGRFFYETIFGTSHSSGFIYRILPNRDPEPLIGPAYSEDRDGSQ